MGAVEELTQEVQFYRAMRQLAELAWEGNTTVEASLALSDLLEHWRLPY